MNIQIHQTRIDIPSASYAVITPENSIILKDRNEKVILRMPSGSGVILREGHHDQERIIEMLLRIINTDQKGISYSHGVKLCQLKRRLARFNMGTKKWK